MTHADRPITHQVDRIVEALRGLVEEGEHKLSFGRLVEALGSQSHRLLILMLTLLNMLPGPPGFGGTLAWTTFAVALFMVLGKPIRLPRIIGDRKLPLKPMLKASEQVARITALIARISKPRLRHLTGDAVTRPYGIFTMLVSVFTTLPIPLINAVPNVGLCVIAFAMLNRDGLGVLLGVVITLVGLGIAAALLLGAVTAGTAALHALF